jgi:hypothetical protein
MRLRILATSSIALSVLALTACASTAPDSAQDGAAPAETSNTEELSPAQTPCPTGILDSVGYGGKPYTEVDMSVVETALAVTLPEGPACVVLNDGDTVNTATAWVFYTDEDQNFANALGNNLVAAGYIALGEPIEYQKSEATVDIYAIEAGDDLHFSGAFSGSPALVYVLANVPDMGYFS